MGGNGSFHLCVTSVLRVGFWPQDVWVTQRFSPGTWMPKEDWAPAYFYPRKFRHSKFSTRKVLAPAHFRIGVFWPLEVSPSPFLYRDILDSGSFSPSTFLHRDIFAPGSFGSWTLVVLMDHVVGKGTTQCVCVCVCVVQFRPCCQV